MTATLHRVRALALHPLHALLVGGAAPLFVGALLSDIAYARTAQPQWANFASWLIVGGMVLTGLALAWSVLGLARPSGRRGRPLIALGFLALTFVIGFVDALWHTRDAWAKMPGALVLSILLVVCAAGAAWAAFSSARGETFQ